jgi:NAD-dependent DNA ligase
MARQNENTAVLDMIEVMEVEGKPLARMRICVSGHLAKPRKEVISLIEQGGGEFHSTMKYYTTHLLTNADWTKNSVDGTSSKFKKAREYGVKIINEEQFLAMLTGSSEER